VQVGTPSLFVTYVANVGICSSGYSATPDTITSIVRTLRNYLVSAADLVSAEQDLDPGDEGRSFRVITHSSRLARSRKKTDRDRYHVGKAIINRI
jgi:hypothetical protein